MNHFCVLDIRACIFSPTQIVCSLALHFFMTSSPQQPFSQISSGPKIPGQVRLTRGSSRLESVCSQRMPCMAQAPSAETRLA